MDSYQQRQNSHSNKIARLATLNKNIVFRTVCANGWDLVIFDWFICMQVIVVSFRPSGLSPSRGQEKRTVQGLDYWLPEGGKIDGTIFLARGVARCVRWPVQMALQNS